MSHRRKPLLPPLISHTAGLLSTDVGGELVVMDVTSGRFFGLDETGAAIWQGIRTPVRLDALCAGLAASSEAEPAALESDVLSLLTGLRTHGLIQVEDERIARTRSRMSPE